MGKQTGNLRSLESQKNFFLRWERLKNAGREPSEKQQSNTLGQKSCPSKTSESKGRWVDCTNTELTTSLSPDKTVVGAVLTQASRGTTWAAVDNPPYMLLVIFLWSHQLRAKPGINNNRQEKEKRVHKSFMWAETRRGSTKRTQVGSQDNSSTSFIMWSGVGLMTSRKHLDECLVQWGHKNYLCEFLPLSRSPSSPSVGTVLPSQAWQKYSLA